MCYVRIITTLSAPACASLLTSQFSCSLLTPIFAWVEQRGPREKVTNDEATAGIIRHTYPYTTKGQEISEGNCGVLKSQANKFFSLISTVVSKNWSSQKNKGILLY